MTARLPYLLAALVSVFVCSAALASTDSDWRTFRERYGYHAQAIAIGSADADGARTIVISEPPPSITFDDVASRYGGTIRNLDVRTHRIGFDGWVKDIVGLLPPMSDARRRSLVEDLSRDLFGTSYKAYAVDISGSPEPSELYDLSVGSTALRVWLGLNPPSRSTFQELLAGALWVAAAIGLIALVRRRWLTVLTAVTVCLAMGYMTSPATPVGTAGALRPLHGGDAASLRTLLAEPAPGVYLSDTPGLVVLVLRRDRPLNDVSIALREFALDSDLILGAVGTEETVAVIGRERQVSVLSLPPLRTETILQLAAAGTDELAQSYERMHIFAGSTGDDHRDWAPIYLSPQLHDTEYGSLLNITDQLLKSWSEHGEIEYINFPYPKPSEFPFETGLLEHAGTSVVTYNWNTKGVGFTDTRDGFDVLAFSRTGALPVDYLGDRDARMREAEERGYEYFAGRTGDPNLARVVQYAGLYQIWRHFGVTADWTNSTRSHDGPDALLPLARALLDMVRDFNLEEEIDVERPVSEETRQVIDEFRQIQSALAAAGEIGDWLLDEVARALVHPRDAPAEELLTDDQKAIFSLAFTISENRVVRALDRPAVPVAFVTYAAAEGKDDPPGWIKTPSVVVSWQTGKNAGRGEGGHNLSSRVSRFEADAALSPGSVRVGEVDGERVLFYHPDDAARIRGAVRSFARNQEQAPGELARTVEAQLRTAPAENVIMRDALNLADRSPNLGRGFVRSPGTSVASAPPWVVGDAVPSTHADLLSGIQEASVFPMVIERADGRYLISRGGQPRVIEATDTASALDAVVASARTEANGRTVHLHFRGMSGDQAAGFSRVAELHAGDRPLAALRTSVETADAGSVKVLGEIRNGRWQVAKAEVRAVEPPTGAIRSALDFDVSVPGEAASLRLRIQVRFREGVRVTAELIARLTESLRAALRALENLGADVDMLLATRRIIATLRMADESIDNVRLRLHSQAGEIDVVRNVLDAPAFAG